MTPASSRYAGLSLELFFRVGLVVCASIGTFWAFGGKAVAQEESGKPSLQIQLGFDGYWKLGHVCPLHIRFEGALASEAKSVRVVSIDGDGVEVTYSKLVEDNSDDLWLSIRIGRSSHRVRVEVLGAAENILTTGQISSDAQKVLDSDQPFVLAIGSSMGLDELSRTTADGLDSNFTCITLESAQELPPHGSDLESCDLLVISTSRMEWVEALDRNWQPIDEYVRRGGGCIFSASAGLAGQVAGDEWRAFLPGPIQGKGMVTDPGVLESLVATEDRMASFELLLLDYERGKVELSLTDRLSRSTPWWTSFSHGHGTVRTVASDLGSEAFQNWKDQRIFWQMLIEPYLDERMLENRSAEGGASDSSYLGYNDLVGQLRATLDVFAGLRAVSFSQVAAILLGILLLVGPVDYLFSVRWLKRPDLSWYFSSLVLVLSSLGLTLYCLNARPDGVLINTAQVVDLDVESGRLNGYLWSHVYSGNARRLDIDAQTRLGGSVSLDWQGLPGTGLGALNSQLTTDRGMPPYQIVIEPEGGSVFKEVGVAAGGTKCLFGNWSGSIQVKKEAALSEIGGVDQLTGEFTNPLEEDIRDAVLFYHNWYYRLNSRILAGQTVSISAETIPKDIARKLNERKAANEKVSSTKWDPADRESLDRLLELMMFYKAATGPKYTSLEHRYQSFLDQSNLLDTDQAILIGRLDNAVAGVEVSSTNGEEIESQQGLDRVWCRLIFPVKKFKK